MSEPGSRRGRPHDAEGAREAIMDAAEAIFAEHGYDGARVDAIAERAGYNKSLVFQYFDNKLNLYAEVIKRTDREMSAIQELTMPALFADPTIPTDARKFRAALETMVGIIYDLMLERPHLRRMIHWEQAENWQTFQQILSSFNTDDTDPLEKLCQEARKNGLMDDYSPLIQLSLMVIVCLAFQSWLPLFQSMRPEENLLSPEAQARNKRFIAQFIVKGLLGEKYQSNL